MIQMDRKRSALSRRPTNPPRISADGSSAAGPALGVSSSKRPAASTLALLGAVVLMGATFLAYLPAVGGAFAYDDQHYVVENPHLRSLGGEFWFWAVRGVHEANWHPLTWFSHAIDLALFGEDPSGHHYQSILFHALNAGLVFALFLHLTGRWGLALVIALIFAFHPLQVESVAWISERKTVLCAFFLLLGMIGYVDWCETKSWRAAIATHLCHLLAIAAKPLAVVFPILLLLLDYWPLERRGRTKILGEKALFFVMSLGCGLATIQNQAEGGATTPLYRIGWLDRTANAAFSYARYLAHFFYPRDLTPFYPYPGMEAPSIGFPALLGSAAILAMITLYALWNRRRRPYLLFGWLWFLTSLLPMIGFIQVGRQAMADRFMYLPIIGLAVAVVFGVREIIEAVTAASAPSEAAEGIGGGAFACDGGTDGGAADGEVAQPILSGLGAMRKTGPALSSIPFAVGAVLTLLTVIACLGLTERQIQIWRTPEGFWRYVVAHAPGAPIPRHNLALLLKEQGDEESLHEAEDLIREAVDQNMEKDARQLAELHVLLSELLAKQEKWTLALGEVAAALVQVPDDPRIVRKRGDYLVAARLYDAAEGSYLKALSLAESQKDQADTHTRLGKLLMERGRGLEAVSHCREALRLMPSPLHYDNLVRALRQVDRIEEARQTLRKGLEAFPGDERLTRTLRMLTQELNTPSH